MLIRQREDAHTVDVRLDTATTRAIRSYLAEHGHSVRGTAGAWRRLRWRDWQAMLHKFAPQTEKGEP